MKFNEEPTPLLIAKAMVERDKAREMVDRLRYLVAIGEEGASALSAAEWTLQMTQRRLDKLHSAVEYGEPLDAA